MLDAHVSYFILRNQIIDETILSGNQRPNTTKFVPKIDKRFTRLPSNMNIWFYREVIPKFESWISTSI